MSVNQRIKMVRTFLGMSQSAFAQNLHLSSGYISSLENGTRTVNLRAIKLICATYGVSEGWLKTGENKMYDDAQDTRLDKAEALFKELYPENQEHFLRLIKTILQIQNNIVRQ